MKKSNKKKLKKFTCIILHKSYEMREIIRKLKKNNTPVPPYFIGITEKICVFHRGCN